MKKLITIGLLLVFLIKLNAQERFDVKFPLEGHLRECIIVKPSNPPPAGGYPVVFMLHGTSGDGEKFYETSGWKELGEQENFITVFPSSLSWCFVDDGFEKHNTRWVNGNVTEFPCSGPPQDYVDDIRFLKLLAKLISDTLPVNNSMIFASGFSNGCTMIHKMANEAGDVFAAVAGTSSMLSVSDSSRPINRIPVWVMVGTLDDRFFTAPLTQLPFGEDSILAYLQYPVRRALGCQGLTENFIKTETDYIHTYKFLESHPGEESKPYIFSLIKDMYHQYPNGTNFPLSAPNIFWEFFKRSVVVSTKFDTKDQLSLQVYPNPSNETIQVQFSNLNSDELHYISAINAYGQSVLSKHPLIGNQIELYKKDFGPGLFLLQLENNKNKICRKFIFN